MTIKLRQGLECDSVKPETARDLGKSRKHRAAESDAVSPKTRAGNSKTTDKSDGKANRLEVIADLLADLRKPERQEVIKQLSPADRAAVALLLAGRID